MNNIQGHAEIINYLKNNDPRNVLLVGPYSVGKRTILQNKVETSNERFQVFSHTVDAEIMRIVQETSFKKNSKIFLRLDRVTKKEEEKFLKIVEDADDSVKFYCTSTKELSLALSTRFTTLRVSYLADNEVQRVLELRGMESSKAEYLASKAYGQVRPTIESDVVVPKMNVMLAMKHILSHDPEGLDSMYAKWSKEDTEILVTYAREILTGRARLFTEEELQAVPKKLALRLLRSSDSYTTPRFYVRSVLAEIEKEMSE